MLAVNVLLDDGPLVANVVSHTDECLTFKMEKISDRCSGVDFSLTVLYNLISCYIHIMITSVIISILN